MFCAQCGEPILGTSSFCDGCGARIAAALAGTAAPTRGAGRLRRIKSIVLEPAAEWRFIASESTSPRELYAGYVAPLAAIGVVASLIGHTLVAAPADPFATALVHALVSYALCFPGVFLVAQIVDRLAPGFGGRRDASAALKLTVYGFTPGWIAGVFNVVPALSALAVVGALYGAYVISLGLPVLMRCPAAKAVGYAVVAVLWAIGAWALLAALALFGSAGIGRVAGELTRRIGA